MIEVKLEGVGKLINDLEKAHGKLKPRVIAAMKMLGIVGKNDWQSNIRMLRAIDTGAYRDSVQYESVDSGLGFEVASDVEYAPFVEWGTRKMYPRPAMRLTAAKVEREIEDILDIWFEEW